MENGIDSHRAWIDEISDTVIYSNDCILGDKFYMTEGENHDTIWYPTPTAAIKAYLAKGETAIRKTAMCDTKPELNLSNINGNAFAILGVAGKVARREKWERQKIEKFMLEAQSGNYDHLLQTCMKYFDVV